MAEITLRIGVRRFRGPVTVPLLVTVGERIMSSHEIARWAERHGTGSPLFLPAETDELEHWITVSDQVMNSGRALLLARMMTDDGALSEQLPRRVPGWLRRPLRGLSRMGVIHLRRKYSGSSRPLEEHEGELRARLEDIRVRTCTRIRADGAPSFSYADITLAASLQFVCPVADSYVQLGPSYACCVEPSCPRARVCRSSRMARPNLRYVNAFSAAHQLSRRACLKPLVPNVARLCRRAWRKGVRAPLGSETPPQQMGFRRFAPTAARI